MRIGCWQKPRLSRPTNIKSIRMIGQQAKRRFAPLWLLFFCFIDFISHSPSLELLLPSKSAPRVLGLNNLGFCEQPTIIYGLARLGIWEIYRKT